MSHADVIVPELVPAGVEAPDRPSSSGAVRRGYLDQALIGYLVYGVGAATAFIAVKLALSDAQAGLHSSTLALGTVLAGLLANRLDRRFGMKPMHVLGLGLLVVAVALLAWAPSPLATLAGAGAVGLGGGLLLGHVNQVMSAGGGALGRIRLTRSTLVAIVTSITVPVFISVGVTTGIGWELILLPALGLAVAGLVMTRGFEARVVGSDPGYARLPRAFWAAWTLVVAVVAVEFATVFWVSPLVSRQSGVPLEEATLTLSALIGGLLVARLALSSFVIGSLDPVWLARVGIALAAVGLLVPWLSTSFELSTAGVFVAGIGMGALYPLGASMMLATAPGRASAASGRLVLASGLAILVSPLLLGVVADVTGVVSAWVLVPGLCLVAMVLTVPVARDRARLGLGAG